MTDDASARDDQFQRGLATLNSVDEAAGQRVIDSLSEVSPELAHQMVAWGYGEIYSRSELSPRDRQLVTLGMLTALGGCEAQLEFHIAAALKVGLAPNEIIETLLHTAVYCGFPRTINATMAAKRVFAAQGVTIDGQPE